MTDRFELNWNLDGFVDEQRYYCSETPIDPLNLPLPKVGLDGNVRGYIDSTIEKGKKYYVAVGSVKDGIEKLSDVIFTIAGNVWTPLNMLNPPKIWHSSEFVTHDSSNRVSQMQDISGNNYHADQTTNANKPLFVSQEVRFDGVDDYLTISSSANNLFRSVNKAWVFAVFKRDQVDYKQKSLISFGTNGTTARVSFNVGSTENQIYFGGRRLDSDSYIRTTHEDPVIEGKYYICFGYIDYSENTIELWVDGTLSDKSINAFPSSGNTSNTASSVIQIGANALILPSVFFNGDLSFTMAGNTAITVEDRQKLEGWAAHKYSLTDNLPTNHPYKILVPTL